MAEAMDVGKKILLGSVVVMIVFIVLSILCAIEAIAIGLTYMDCIVFGLVALLLPYGIYDLLKQKKIKKIEDRLPDFLRDVAEAGRFGMTLADSMIIASYGRYGALTPEIKKMAAQIDWGVHVDEALLLFIERVNTPLVNRMFSIIIKANDAGGNVADVLNMVARNAKENQLMEKERAIEMSTYSFVLFIAFGVFLVTVIILNNQFLPQMELAGRATEEGFEAAGIDTTSMDTIAWRIVPEIKLIFTVAALMHAVGDGIMAGVLKDGRIASGLFIGAVLLIAGHLILRMVGG